MKINNLVLAFCLILLASACSLVPAPREIVVYQLIQTDTEKASSTANLVLKIMSVQSSPALNSRRILVTEDGKTLDALPGARWASPIQALMRDRLVESMRANGAIAHVISDKTALQSDMELHTFLRDFVGEFSARQPIAYIRLDATLTRSASRKIVASREFSIRVASRSQSADDLVQAFSAATDQMALELVNWILANTSNQND